MKFFLPTLIVLTAFGTNAWAAEAPKPADASKPAAPAAKPADASKAAAPAAKGASDKTKASYAFGLNFGQRLKPQAHEIDAASFARGLQDAMTGKKPAYTDQELSAAVQKFQEEQNKKRQAMAEEAKKKGEKYLADYKKKDGVKILDSGVQYKVVKEGKGKSPKPTDTVSVHYKGTLINGTEFDSSLKRNEPATFPVNGVIAGWQEVLPLMKEGDKWEVVIPSDKAYGPNGAGPNSPIGPNETLVFEIELISVKAEEAKKDDKK
jgi:FKBP-type peptidyl-prolyl cis-trans isomerase FklB